MADSILSFAVQKLWVRVSQEYERFQGVEEQITELKCDLNMLMAFLCDADEKKQTRALARNCLEEIKEITYDAEDIIETFLLKDGGVKNHMRSLACFPRGRREIALQITSISKRISKVIQVMQTLGIKSDIMDGGYSEAQLERKRETRHTFYSESETNFVGLERKVKRLVDYLVEDDSSPGVSITGLGGLGKTTLARQIFNHDTVKSHFEGLAWVCVSQDYTRKDVWKTILGNLSPGDKDPNMEEDDIQKKLVQLLEKKKVLIIFDDLWRKEDWEKIKPIFPPDRKGGWKVLITSRNDAVYPECIPFKPKFLEREESLTLLQMIAFPKNDIETGYIINKEMEDMAKEMIEHCGGLPLAVKVLGGLLAAQHTPRQWKLISENIKSHILLGGVSSTVEDSSSVDYILSLSFEGLPSYLKQCLLYLASFPEDRSIEIERLAYVWAAEGIKKPRYYEGATIQDVADFCIQELVMRNLVISEKDELTSRFEYCQLHDLMREICLLKSKEENFLQIVSDPTSSSNVQSLASSKSRRLVVYRTDSFKGQMEIKNTKLRSLLFIPFCDRRGLKLMELPLLRVLDLSFAEFKGWGLPTSIGKLIHLKYLSLYRALVTHLPSSLRNLKSLLYLNLDTYSRRGTIVPNVFEEMPELTYLCLPSDTLFPTKLKLGNLLNLESLHNFSTKHSSVTDLHRMTRLRSLSITGKVCDVETLTSTLSRLEKLEHLNISFNLEFSNIMFIQQKLPDVQHLPSHLIDISLYGCRLEEDPMPILGKLLQLKSVELGFDSYVGRKMVCSGRGFPQLQILKLNYLFELEEWIAEEGSMPLLHTLIIEWCPKLKKLPVGQRFIIPKLQKLSIESLAELEEWIVEEGSMPLLHTLNIVYCHKLKLSDGMRFITSLKELYISTREAELQKKVSKGGEDYYKIQHIPLIQYGWLPEPEENEGN